MLFEALSLPGRVCLCFRLLFLYFGLLAESVDAPIRNFWRAVTTPCADLSRHASCEQCPSEEVVLFSNVGNKGFYAFFFLEVGEMEKCFGEFAAIFPSLP